METIKSLFEPQSIAVIGASHNKQKIGCLLLNNIIQSGYNGRIYPINAGGGKIMGLKTYKNIRDIDDTIDVVCTAIPAPFVFDSVKDCAEKGVKYNLIITSGFSEVGNIEEEEKITKYGRDHGMRIIGPNVFGLYSASASLDATFGPGNILPGSVAIITQSGALGLAMIGKTTVENIGLSAIVSVGNKCDVDEADLLDYLADQDQTKVILMYIEGIKNGNKFMNAVQKATRKKPIIVIKSGRSKRGASAAASHTGSLAGADEIIDAIMKQCGVLRAESIRDAFNWSKYLAASPAPENDSGLIITNGGGVGVMATDACEQYNVELFDDGTALKTMFEAVTPGFGSTKNPVDITGGAGSSEYTSALEVAMDCDCIGATMALYCETATFLAPDVEKMIRTCFDAYKKAGKPILFAIVGGVEIEKIITLLSRENIPVFGDIYEAVACLGKLYEYHRYLQLPLEKHETVEVSTAVIDDICQNAIRDNRYFLLANEAKKVMESAGISVPKSKVARNLKEAVNAAEEINYPVVMKVVSKDIIHKSDAGGIALDLVNEDEIIDAYQAIIRNCRNYAPAAKITGVEIAEMLSKDIETIVGARRDPVFGPIIMFGLGGVYVEIMKDVAFRALPLSRTEIIKMIKETRSYPLLLGVRGEEKKDMDAVIDVILKLSSLIKKCPFIADIEINPLMVYEQDQGTKAVDVRILLTQA
jgi:acetyl coenzyme A synthetase (ADP forming)-like protein